MYKINDKIVVKATELSYEGYGVVRSDKQTLFVENLLPDEEAEVAIYKSNSKIAYGRTVNLIKKSCKRVEVVEKELFESGAAPLMVLSYEDQLKFKQEIVNNLIKRNIGFQNIEQIQPSPKILNYRNKITLHVNYKNNNIYIGFYKKNSNKLVIQNSLPLCHDELDKYYKELISALKQQILSKDNWIKELKLRQITLRHSNWSHNIEVIFIIENPNKKGFDLLKNNLIFLLKPNVISIQCQYIKESKDIFTSLYKSMPQQFNINNKIFNVNNDSFFQVNEEQTSLIYNQIKKFIDQENSTKIIDVYSGVGSIGISVCGNDSQLELIEINKSACECAKININQNLINPKLADMTNSSAQDFFNKKEAEYFEKSIVIFDPPRTGLTNKEIDMLEKCNSVIYMSCNPHTMIRDLKYFEEKGYRIERLIPYDMFPQTYHIEMLSLLKK